MSEKPAEPGRTPVEFSFRVPEEEKTGVYSNILAVSHTPHEFTLDFGVAAAATPPQNPQDPDSPARVAVEIVSRVKIPPTVMFDVLRALNENMTRYESRYGEIRRLEPPEERG